MTFLNYFSHISAEQARGDTVTKATQGNQKRGTPGSPGTSGSKGTTGQEGPRGAKVLQAPRDLQAH